MGRWATLRNTLNNSECRGGDNKHVDKTINRLVGPAIVAARALAATSMGQTPLVVVSVVIGVQSFVVAELVNERSEAGVHEVKFDASNLSSGVYLYRLTAGSYVQTRRLLLLK